MAYNAGDVEARLTLDRSAFITGLRESVAEGERFEKRKFEAKAGVKDETQPTITAMQRRLMQFAGRTFTAKARVDFGKTVGNITGVQNRLNAFARRTYTAKARVDIGNSIGTVTRFNKAIQTIPERVDTMVHVDVAQAYADLMRFRAAYRQILSDKVVNFRIEVDMQGSIAELMALDRIVSRLDGRTVRIRGDSDLGRLIASLGAATAATHRASNAADRYRNRLILLTAAITGVAAPALGLLASLLLTLPTVALMAGAAVGAIALGINGIKNAAAQLGPQMDALKASVSSTFEQGLIPVFRQLGAIFPVLTEGMNGQARALVAWAAAFTGVITSAQGLQQLNVIFAGLNGFIMSLVPTVTNMTQAFMTLGVVGTQTLWSLSNALNGWTAGFNAMIQQAAATGLLANAFIQLGNVVGSLLGLLNQLFLTGMQAMAALGPNMTYAVNALSNAIRALTPTLITLGAWFFNLIGATLNFAAALADFLGPALPVVLAGLIGIWAAAKAYAAIIAIVNVVTKAWALIMGIIRVATVAWTIVQWGLNAALLANPVGIVVAAVLLLIAAVGALIYGIVKLIQNWDTVVNALKTGWQAILDAGKMAIDAILRFFTELPGKVGYAMGFILGAVVKFFTDTVPAWQRGAAEWIVGLITGLRDNWPQVLVWLANMPLDVLKACGNVALWLFGAGMDVMRGFLDGLSSMFQWCINGVLSFVANFIQGFKDAMGIASPSTIFAAIGVDIITGLLNGIITTAGQVITFFLDFASSIIETVSNAFTTIQSVSTGTWIYISTWFNERLAAFNQFWSSIWNLIGSFFSNIWTAMQATAVNVWTAIANFLVAGIQAFTNLWNTLWGALANLFTSIWIGLRDIAVNSWNALAQFVMAGVNAFASFWNATWQALATFFTNIWNGISTFFTNVWNAMFQFGSTIIRTLIGVFTGEITSFSQFWNAIWGAIQQFFVTIWNALQAFAVATLNALIAFWTSTLNAFSAFWSQIWNAISLLFTQVWTGIQNFAVTIWNALVAFWTTSLNAFAAFWNGLWTAVQNFFVTIWNAIQSSAIAIWNAINGFFVGALNTFSGFWTNTWNGIRDAFGSAFGGIVNIATAIWNQVKGVFAAGLNAIINGVNWPIDKINGLFGISIPRIPNVPALATGGTIADGGAVRGPGTSTNDKILTRLSRNEHVWNAREVRAAGGHEAVRRMRAAVMNPSRTANDGIETSSKTPERRALVAQSSDAAPKGLGTGFLNGLRRLQAMDKNPTLDDVGMGNLAYGGVRPHVAAAGFEVERLFGRMPGGIGGVGARSGPSDHPRGLALDFMTLSNMGLGDRIAGHFLANSARLAVKYIIWKQAINSGSGWRGMENRGSPTANHMDHPHVSFLDGPGGGRAFGAGGGLFTIDYGAIFDSLAATIGLPGSAEPIIRGLIPDNPAWMDSLGVGVYRKAWDGLRKKAIELMQSFGGMFGAGGTGPAPGGGGAVERWRPLVLAALARQGLPASYADRVLMQINSESGGNPRAVNNWDINARRGTPSGGLLQTIAPTFNRYRDPGIPGDMFDPFANINASLRYAMARYGSLDRAYRGVGYDGGGVLPKGISLVHNATNAGENMAVFDNGDWATLKSLASSGQLPRVSSGGGITSEQLENLIVKLGDKAPTIGTLAPMLPAGARVHDVIEEIMFRMRHYKSTARYK